MTKTAIFRFTVSEGLLKKQKEKCFKRVVSKIVNYQNLSYICDNYVTCAFK